MSARALKIKVNVHDLIGKIEAARDEVEIEYEANLCAYEDAVPLYRKAIAGALEVLAKVAKTKDVSTWNDWHGGRDCVVVPLDLDLQRPEKPLKPDLSHYDKDIAILKMAIDDTIMISADDRYARYL